MKKYRSGKIIKITASLYVKVNIKKFIVSIRVKFYLFKLMHKRRL